MSARAFADERTLEALDFASVRARVVAATRTARGRAEAERLTPRADVAVARIEQARTAAVRELIASADFHVEAASDPSELTQAAALGRGLSGEHLRAIATVVAAAAAAYRAAHDCSALLPILTRYRPLRELQRALDDALDERGVVLDRASPALARIRRAQAHANAEARERVAAILRSAKYAKFVQDRVVTIRDERFVVPIKAEFAGEFPGIVHDSSASGQTLFIEPLEALAGNNRLRTLRIEEEREVARILDELSRRVGGEAAAIEGNVAMLAALDLLAAKAEIARAMDAVQPELRDDATIRIVHGRHPLLDARAVAQSLALDDAARLLVISGPNMGGKTVALKMVGLFVAMAYCGMQVPAASGTEIGTYATMLADIGDEQSIVANASTFSAHLQRMRELLDRADTRTLALVDEIGGGTEPAAGAALAVALLERLLERGTSGIVTTHATELKLFAHATPGVRNAGMRFDPQTFAPTYELDLDTPGRSLAFALARSMGIELAIVERAESLLQGRERDYEAALAELAQRSAELQVERVALARERAAGGAERAELGREREGLAAAQREFVERSQERLAQALRDFVAELEARAATRPKVTRAQTGALARAGEAIRREFLPDSSAPEAAPSDDYARNDPVRVRSLGQEGVVVEDYGETVLVAVGAMKTVVPRDDLERRAARQARRATAGTSDARLDAVARAQAELDVRGKRFVEAEPLVERWIDEALLAGTTTLRLIHGKGSGMLGRGLQEHLRTHPAIQSIRYGNEDEGSAGVSILQLRG